MADHSHIQWTDATWNVASGCTKVSEGCRHCYIERTPPFRTQARHFVGPHGAGEPGATTGVVLHPERLGWPLRWRQGRRVFVNSLSDLYHPEVPDEFIAAVFEVMARTPRHTYQVLTKRPARMASLVTRWMDAACWPETGCPIFDDDVTPLPNVWLGTSVEDQPAARRRIPKLLATPAAVRFLSCEPLLAPVDLAAFLFPAWCPSGCGCRWPDDADARECGCDGPCTTATWNPDPGIHWVIVGGESGPDARPMQLAWARDLLAQCEAAGVAVFCKQLGTVWAHTNDPGGDPKGGDWTRWPQDLRIRRYPDLTPPDAGPGAGGDRR